MIEDFSYRDLENNEVSDQNTNFSQNALEALKKRTSAIYTLTGLTIGELHRRGYQINGLSDSQSFIENLPSRKSQVAIISQGLPDGYNKSMSEQLMLVKKYSEEISQQILDVEAVIGSASDYVELAYLHQKATGKTLFEWEIEALPRFLRKFLRHNMYTRTTTSLETRQGSFLVAVGHHSGRLILGGWPREQASHVIGITPIIIPKMSSEGTSDYTFGVG